MLPVLALAALLALAPAAAARAEELPPAAGETPPAVLPAGPAATGTPASGTEPEPDPEGGQVTVVAERVSRDEASRLVLAEGAVEIRHRDLRLVADRVVYHEDTRDVIADGNVVMDSGEDRIQGEHLEINLATRVGFLERGQGFVQSYYFTGDRIDKLGPDRYFVRRGTFTTCEGQRPDWSIHSTSTTITIDEYLHAWNPSLRLKWLPVFYLPYAVFPVKRDRSTGLLIPEIKYSDVDGFVIRNAFYWAPRDNFDATIGLEWLQESGWAVSGETRYLLAARTHGEVDAYWVRDPDTEAERWVLSSRHSHELPLGFQGEAEVLVQSDRQVISTYGQTLEERSSESTSSSFYVNRSWSSYDFSVAGRRDDSLYTERRTTLTRFPEVTVERTSARLFETDVFLKVFSSGVRLSREEDAGRVDTDRYHLAPEASWPISLGGVASVIPGAGYALTWYTQGLDGEPDRRAIPFYRLGLEGPRPYRIFELGGERIEKLKHLVEPRVTYFYTPEVDQANLPQFDSIDTIPRTNRVEYSLTNTLFAKVRSERPRALGAAGEGGAGGLAGAAVGAGGRGESGAQLATSGDGGTAAAAAAAEAAGEAGAPAGSLEGAGAGAAAGEEGATAARASFSTQELFWLKLSQSYHLNAEDRPEGEAFSPLEWDARTRPARSVELWWRGNYDVYGRGIGFQNVSLSWQFAESGSFRGEWRTARDSNQDFLDVGVSLGSSPVRVEGRSRYNLAEDAFVENRVGVGFISQCWEITLGYVKWPTEYEYSLQISLKGIGTVVKI